MNISAKSLPSDRFIASRIQSVPKNAFTNNLKQSHKDKLNNGFEVFSKSTLSNKQISITHSISTKETSVRNFVQNTIPKSTISSKAIQTISPWRMLEATPVVDNYYHNNLDVAFNDLVAVGVSRSLMILKGKEQSVSYLQRTRENLLSCVKFSSSIQAVFSGDESGYAEFFDIQNCTAIRNFRAHALRIGRIENHETTHDLIFTGSKDYDTKIHDLKMKHSVVGTFQSEKSEVTGLVMKDNFLATGHNNGKLIIWDVRNKKQMIKLQNHSGAIKALSWCPWKAGTILSGGGKKDTEIIVYNSLEQKVQGKIPTKNQISEICWKVSSHQMIYSESRIQSQPRIDIPQQPTLIQQPVQLSSNISTQPLVQTQPIIQPQLLTQPQSRAQTHPRIRSHNRHGKIHISNQFNPRAKKVKFQEMHGRILAMKINPSSDNLLISLSGDDTLAYWDMGDLREKVNISDILEIIE